MKKYKVPFIRPDFPSAEDMLADYADIVEANWFTNFGPFERKFSKEIASYVGNDYFACTLSSATAALIGSVLVVLGKGDGSKYVIMPAFTFAAVADALVWCGYKPLFIDIEEQGLQTDITEAKNALSDDKQQIAGILFCNAFGVGTTNIAEWEELSHEYDLPLIIDSAAGFGSLYSADRKVGSAGTCEIFSFHATKPFSIGEGGAVVSNDEALISKLKSIQNFGFRDGKNNATTLGFNGKLQEINAAIGLRQLSRFEHILTQRQGVLKRYKDGLSDETFRPQVNAENASLCFATFITDPTTRDKALEALRSKGVDAKTYYSPSLHKHEYFKECSKFSDLANTEKIDKRVLSLPVHDNMRAEDVDLIINTLNE